MDLTEIWCRFLGPLSSAISKYLKYSLSQQQAIARPVTSICNTFIDVLASIISLCVVKRKLLKSAGCALHEALHIGSPDCSDI